MLKTGFAFFPRILFVLISFGFASACSVNTGDILYEGEDFTFSAPAGYKTEQVETPYFDPTTNSDLLLFSNVGHYPYFEIFRAEIPAGSDLDTVFADYVSLITQWHHPEFISQNIISMDGRTAIELVHREFVGEPYVQAREIWMEYNGWAYSLVCVSPISAGTGTLVPISENCIRLAESFHFK
jgi:hypothetical protein